MNQLEKLAHIRVNDRDYSIYIAICHETLTLHAFKYDDYNIEWETFQDISQFKLWCSQPVKRISI